MRLRHDAVAHALVQRTGDDRVEQRAGVALAQPADAQLRQPLEVRPSLGSRTANTSATRSARRRRATKRERLRRHLIEPLRVVDEADQRLVLGHLGHQDRGGARPTKKRSGDVSAARGRTPSPGHRAAAPGAGRADPASVRRAVAARRTRAPASDSTPAARATWQPADALAARSPAPRSCPSPPRRAGPAPDRGPPAHRHQPLQRLALAATAEQPPRSRVAGHAPSKDPTSPAGTD